MELTAKKPLSQFQLISMIHRDKPPRMLVRLPILRSRESSTNQLLLLSLSVLTRQTVKSLPFMILEVELSIFPSSKSLVVSLRSRLPTVIPPSEEKISISAFKNSWFLSSRANTEWTLPKTSLPCKESERLQKKLDGIERQKKHLNGKERQKKKLNSTERQKKKLNGTERLQR